MKSIFSVLACASAVAAQSLSDVLKASNQTTSLQAAIAAVPGLADTLSAAQGLTIFAPTNAAFEQFLAANGGPAVLNMTDLVRSVLQYHVLNGTVKAADITSAGKPLFAHTLLNNASYSNVTGGQYVEAVAANNSVKLYSGLGRNATVVTADITYNNGVVHLIDQVLTVPQNVSATAAASNLTSLASALNSTGLTNAINTTPNITIFAPVNAAFSAIQSVLANASAATVTTVLQYHVVPGAVIFSTQLADGAKVSTLNTAANLTVTKRGSTFFVNGAAIVKPNILVANGVVHLIDQVLNPSNASATPAATATTGATQFNASGTTTTTGGGSSSSTPGNAGSSVQAYPLLAAAIAGAAFLL